LRVFASDLHIHTCLSPCAELDMSPMRIVEEALARKLDIIAITDHNSGQNVRGVKEAAKNKPLKVFCGMEVTTAEEVHVLGYFPSLKQLAAFQQVIYENLAGTAAPRTMGEQVIADGKDQVLGFCGKNLFSAVSLSIESIVKEIHAREGLAVAAHIDREGFGLIGQLGFVPEGLELDAAEYYDTGSPLRTGINFPAITSSDSHEPCQIGTRRTRLIMMKPTFGEFRMALRGHKGRKVEA